MNGPEDDAVGVALANTEAAGARDPSEMAVPQESTRPARYGRYHIRGTLGAGGMGVVYDAYDPELDRRVALKVIGPSQRQRGREGRDRLLREARALARLSHPNVIAIHDVGSTGEDAFVAMELVHGRTLDVWLRECAPTRAAVLEVFAQAGRGLIAAHAAGLVHRDFKPSNVMVGEDERVRVLDFGIARQVALAERHSLEGDALDGGASALGAPLTQTGGVVGTPSYMAPEQCMGGQIDERTDQFSFCVTLHEALYGIRPFSGNTYAELTRRICAGDIDEPPAGSDVPANLRAAVLRGLRVEPGERHPSLASLLSALAQPAQPGRGRRIAVFAVAAVFALAAVAGSALYMRSGESGASSAAVARAGELRMQVVDTSDGALSELVGFVERDPRARSLGIEVAATSRVSALGATSEAFVSGPDRHKLQRYLDQVFREHPELAIDPGHELLLRRHGDRWLTCYLWSRVELDSSFIRRTSVYEHPSTGQPEVLVEFDEPGARRLAAVTGQNIGRPLAIVIDGTVTSAAVLNGAILGGRLSISLDESDPSKRARAAEQLARSLARH